MKCWGIDMAHLIVRDDAGNVTFDSNSTSVYCLHSTLSLSTSSWVYQGESVSAFDMTMYTYRYSASWLKKNIHFIPIRCVVVYDGYMDFFTPRKSVSDAPTGVIPFYELRG